MGFQPVKTRPRWPCYNKNRVCPGAAWLL